MPTTQTRQTSRHGGSSSRSRTRQNQITILIIDNNSADLRAVERSLEGLDLKIETVSDWNSTWAAAMKNPALVLLETQIPNIDCSYACSMLKRARPDLKIILFSNMQPDELTKLVEEYGADGYIQKQLDPDQLESLPEQLSQFISLPALPSNPITPTNTSGKKLLIVDTSNLFTETDLQTIQQNGFEIRIVRDWMSISASVREFNPDLVLLDKHLDGIPATAVCKSILGHYPTKKIVLFAERNGTSDNDFAAFARQHGAQSMFKNGNPHSFTRQLQTFLN